MKQAGIASLVVAAVIALGGFAEAHEKYYSGNTVSTFSNPRCEGTSVSYVAASTLVLRDGLSDETLIDEDATVACTADGGPGLGGGFIEFGSGDSIRVEDDSLGASVAFQVCLDNDNDGDCHAGPEGNPCPDQVYFSHDDDGSFANPLGPLATAFSTASGCPTEHRFDGYVVFVCEGIHNDGSGAHRHTATKGIISATTGGAPGGNFCQIPDEPTDFGGKHFGRGVKRYEAPGELATSAMDCGEGNDPVLNISYGGVCFGGASDGNFVGGGSHLIGTSTEVLPGVFRDVATITVVDNQFQSTLQAFYCQDLNGDGFCGGDPEDAGDGFREEPAAPFCGSINLYAGVDDIFTGPHGGDTPPAYGWSANVSSDDESWGYLGDGVNVPPRGNWNAELRVYAFIMSLNQGNPLDPNDPCAPFSPGHYGTKGFVDHA